MLSHWHVFPWNNAARDGADIIALCDCPHTLSSNCNSNQSPKNGKVISAACREESCHVAKGLARALSAPLASLLASKDARFRSAQRQRLREKPGWCTDGRICSTGRTSSKEWQCLWLSLWIVTFACWGRYIQMWRLTFNSANFMMSYSALTGAMGTGSSVPVNTRTLLSAGWAGTQSWTGKGSKQTSKGLTPWKPACSGIKSRVGTEQRREEGAGAPL